MTVRDKPYKTRRRPGKSQGTSRRSEPGEKDSYSSAKRPSAGSKAFSESKKPPRAEPYAFTLNVSPVAAKALNRIGVPEKAPFVPDPFQLEAVAKSADGDVIVAAPTGSGKTWIAEQAMARELERGGRCWYASPLKALSNAKFLEFGRIFGPERVGILTGDHKVNTDAPLIIGTTEILRNQLYDAMSGDRDLDADLIVADEAHYLGDRDRGVVWEEVMIYLPPRIKLLLLSATVANSAELAAWLGHHRGREVAVVNGGERPVPLAGLCLWPSGQMVDLASAASRRGGNERNDRNRRAFFNIQMPNSKIMGALRELDLLPAIFFLKSRADCDAALSQSGGPPRESPERFAARQTLLDEFLEKYPFLADHPHLGRVRRSAVAAHHAGHLPHYKLLVEELMSRGLLDAIFAT
ncbi:MAG: DEAD/DEAH box helicase, partial [Candidatus Adiutrix sp.]|nr:DEAD/DEAH box helicase [Candidatus Adiutrix sp.]